MFTSAWTLLIGTLSGATTASCRICIRERTSRDKRSPLFDLGENMANARRASGASNSRWYTHRENGEKTGRKEAADTIEKSINAV